MINEKALVVGTKLALKQTYTGVILEVRERLGSKEFQIVWTRVGEAKAYVTDWYKLNWIKHVDVTLIAPPKTTKTFEDLL